MAELSSDFFFADKVIGFGTSVRDINLWRAIALPLVMKPTVTLDISQLPIEFEVSKVENELDNYVIT